MTDSQKQSNDPRKERLYGAKVISMYGHTVDPDDIVKALFPRMTPANPVTGVSVEPSLFPQAGR